jgi:hypothetical protein
MSLLLVQLAALGAAVVSAAAGHKAASSSPGAPPPCMGELLHNGNCRGAAVESFYIHLTQYIILL